MREYSSGQEDPLRNLISTTALLLLSSVVTETTAFSLKHDALFGTNKSSQSEPGEAIAAVSGVSPPLLDKAMSLFDHADGKVPVWPVTSVLNTGKVLPMPDQFKPFLPFMPIQPFGMPQQHMPQPGTNEKDPGVVVPQPPEIPAPLNVNIVEPQSSESHIPVEGPAQIPGGMPEWESSAAGVDLYDEVGPEEESPVLSNSSPLFIVPSQFGWIPHPNTFPTSGGSQQLSMNVNSNSAEITASNNINVHIVTDGEGNSSKHFIGSTVPLSEEDKEDGDRLKARNKLPIEKLHYKVNH